MRRKSRNSKEISSQDVSKDIRVKPLFALNFLCSGTETTPRNLERVTVKHFSAEIKVSGFRLRFLSRSSNKNSSKLVWNKIANLKITQSITISFFEL